MSKEDEVEESEEQNAKAEWKRKKKKEKEKKWKKPEVIGILDRRVKFIPSSMKEKEQAKNHTIIVLIKENGGGGEGWGKGADG